MNVADTVFRFSTPAPNLDGTIPTPWRVADATALRAFLASKGYDNARAYVEYESRTRKGRPVGALWVGLRDNRDRVAHSAALVVLGDLLKEVGFNVTFYEEGHRIVGIVLVDHVRA